MAEMGVRDCLTVTSCDKNKKGGTISVKDVEAEHHYASQQETKCVPSNRKEVIRTAYFIQC